MRTASIARCARSTLALVAGAALLSLGACGTDAGDGAEEPSAAPSTSSEDGGGQESGQAGDDEQASDGGGAATGDEQDDENGQTDQPDQSDGAGSEEGEDQDATNAAGDRTQIMLRTELGTDDTSGEGAPVLANDDLAALLAEPFGGTAECADELVLEPGAASVGCVGPASFDDTAPTTEWVANVILVPSEDGFQNGSTVAVLFSTGVELPEAAGTLLQENVSVTGVGFGSAFGMEPLSAEQVAESTLQTLTSENAYVPTHEMAEWSEVTCEDGLDFTEFETVDCVATTTGGDSWQLHVAPGTYADNDQGLLVGIGSPRDA